MKIRTYKELSRIPTFMGRAEYLFLNGQVGRDTFGFDRVFNQMFYKSEEWRQIKPRIISRDLGCDLGVEGYDILEQRIIIHHMNPISLDDIKNSTEFLLCPEYLITTTHFTHNAIHYGLDSLIDREPVQRRPNDTCPWKL